MVFPIAGSMPRTITENRVKTHPVGGVKAERLKRFFAELPDDADVNVEITDKGKSLVATWTRRRSIKQTERASDVNAVDEE